MSIFESVIPNGISACHTISNGYSMKTMHAHDGYEIHFTRCRGLNFFINDKIYPIDGNSLLVFCSTDLHKINVPDDVFYDRYIVYFDPAVARYLSDAGSDLLEGFERRPDGITPQLLLSEQDAAEFERLADALCRTYDSGEHYGRSVELKLLLGEMLLLINRLFRIKCTDPHAVNDIRIANHHMNTVTTYIDEHFAEEIRLSDMAGVCHLDKTYLCRLFKKTTGLCITDYINYRRLSYSAQQLRQGKSVSEVAHSCGFNSDAYFITTFKRIMGCTPKQYAKANCYVREKR